MTTQTKALDAPLKINSQHIIVSLISVATFIFFTTIGLNHEEGEAYGWMSLLPTALVLVFALTTHRTVEALFSGAIAGVLLLNPTEAVEQIVDISMSVMMDETIAWIILVCGLMGGLIAILEKGGSILSFSDMLVTKVKSRKQSMLMTFALGILIFIDDYLNAIAISSSMKKVTDGYQISREKLSYLVDSTAAPICILVPISTWAIFFSSLLEANGVAEAGDGIKAYIEAIPYMAYGWVTLVIVLLVAMEKIPDLGAMKKAEKRAKNGQVRPDGATDVDFGPDVSAHTNPTMGLVNFLLPMIVLVAASWYFGIDLLAGVFVALIFTISFYGAQKLISMNDMFEAVYDGIKVMLLPLATVIGGFMLKSVNDSLGVTQYVIETVSPYLSASYFPAIIFMITGALVFATASSWGTFAVAMPIVLPLGEQLGVPLHLTVAALLSASAAGSHSCFFSDSTVLSAQGSGCTAMQHATTQFPYALIGIVATAIFFFIIG
ncbi:Na+/H+ antiporter NhaC family protein [Vibrio sp. Vb0937]|uniref:Na+/H+ antiporter NhaC family protein n=1 Tax=unclassified Vibrio TaxID=2614977 RepID=UPI0021D1C306|nr:MULTISPECIES: Na+/H+ antiporter NhaC family protein [unclassified Vibrio]MDW1825554.1 Na+/H+ antiporter NhaC family protein [Vibrio sp. Vb0937]MDW3186537.1 Na+/H+ antiporter NhaC family protein [Vibrio sp. Vb0932]HCZ9273753.1 sodium:proton antiporter [Vibrio alginolyticus]